MTPKTQKQQTQEIWQGMYGVPGTEDNGFLGAFKDLLSDYADFKNQTNKRINKLSTKLKVLIAFLIGSGVLGTGIWQLLVG